MAITRRPTGTLADIQQVDPGVYLDTAGGGYYTGTWDNPTFIGDTYTPYGSQPIDPGGRAQPAPYGNDARAIPTSTQPSVPYGDDAHAHNLGPSYGTDGRAVPVPPTTTSVFRPSTIQPTGNLNYQQALDYVQQGSGRSLSPQDIASLFQRFGGSQSDTFQTSGLDPVIAYLRGGTTPPPATPPTGVAPPGTTIPYGNDVIQNGTPTTGVVRRSSDGPRINADPSSSQTQQTQNAATTTTVNGLTGRQYMTNLLGSKYANDPDEAARQYNILYGATTGNEAYYDPSRNVIVTPFSGYFANGANGWQFAETHEGGPGGGGGGGASNYNFQQALDVVQRAIGRSLTPAEIDEAFKKFGGTRNDTFTDSGLAPVIAYFKGSGGGNPPPTPGPRNIPTGTYGGPSDGGVFGDRNLQQLGQDPFSLLLTGGLGALINSGGQGISGFGDGIRQALLNNIYSGGHYDTSTEALNLETARGVADRARKAEMSGITGQLASRGLLSEPGYPQGPEIDATHRLEENVIAPLFANATQGYLINEGNKASDRYTAALNAGTNLSNSDNRTLLDALRAGTDRQGVLSDVAIRELEQNRLFNQFLATYGLDVDKFINELQTGQNTSLIALLQQFLNLTGISTGGFV